jgi:hypothetical protein
MHGRVAPKAQQCPFATRADYTKNHSTLPSAVAHRRSQSVVFITGMFGLYERSLKEPAVAPTPLAHAAKSHDFMHDFVCFCDAIFAKSQLEPRGQWRDKHGQNVVTRTKLKSSVWTLDWTPYHPSLAAHADPFAPTSSTPKQNKSISAFTRHAATFALGKWYKTQFQRIQPLRAYRWVVWLDGTIELQSAHRCAHFIASTRFTLLALHNSISCSMQDEMRGTLGVGRAKYMQFDVQKQYASYLAEGMPTKIEQYITCFFAVDTHNTEVLKLLDEWYAHVTLWSPQDQLSFNFLAWKYARKLRLGTFVEDGVNATTGINPNRRRTTRPPCYTGFACAMIKHTHGAKQKVTPSLRGRCAS